MKYLIETAINSFREYLRSIRLSTVGDKLEFEYTVTAYDYIDDDLDFDEEYYSNMCMTFQKWLEATALDMIRSNEIGTVEITQNKMVFSDKDEHVQTVTFSRNSGMQYVSVMREKREKL